jgi:hypothetical protein
MTNELGLAFLIFVAPYTFAQGTRLNNAVDYSPIISLAQKGATTARTKGDCSPIIYGNNNVFECGDTSSDSASLDAEQHLQPELIIDKIVDGKVDAYHLRVQNIGSKIVFDVSVFMSPSVAISLADLSNTSPVTSTLPPRGGKVSINGIDPSALSKQRGLYVVFLFRTKEGLRSVDHISSNRFEIPNDSSLTGPFDPRTFFEATGTMKEQSRRALIDDAGIFTMQVFSGQPQGTVEFVLPEVQPDGSPNSFQLMGSRLALVMNVAAHTAIFADKVNGISLRFHFEPKPLHSIAAAWDDKGPSYLMIDGQSVARPESPDSTPRVQ